MTQYHQFCFNATVTISGSQVKPCLQAIHGVPTISMSCAFHTHKSEMQGYELDRTWIGKRFANAKDGGSIPEPCSAMCMLMPLVRIVRCLISPMPEAWLATVFLELWIVHCKLPSIWNDLWETKSLWRQRAIAAQPRAWKMLLLLLLLVLCLRSHDEHSDSSVNARASRKSFGCNMTI